MFGASGEPSSKVPTIMLACPIAKFPAAFGLIEICLRALEGA